MRFAEFGGVAVGDHGELGKVAVLEIIGDALYTKNLRGVCRRGHESSCCGLNDRDVGAVERRLPQFHHEAAMVERFPQGSGRRGSGLWIFELDGISMITNIITLNFNRVDLVEAIAQAKLFQGLHATGL
jgi:hypothetical protein